MITFILFWFVFTLFCCYTAGCFYPSWFFPDIIRDFGALTPAGVAFDAIKAGSQSCLGMGAVLCAAYGAVFLFFAFVFHKRRVSR